jgi:hypothetical protein
MTDTRLYTNERRPPPPTFAQDVAEARLSMRRLQEKYHTSPPTLRRWAAETGVSLANFPSTAGRWSTEPPDWRTLAPTMTVRELMQHYQLSGTSVRWLAKKTGVTPKRAKRGRKRIGPTPPIGPTMTDLDAAAHHLRRHYSRVHRCDILLYDSGDMANRRITWGDERGLANHGKDQYFVDTLGILANKDVVELARSLGWKGAHDG